MKKVVKIKESDIYKVIDKLMIENNNDLSIDNFKKELFNLLGKYGAAIAYTNNGMVVELNSIDHKLSKVNFIDSYNIYK